MTVHDPRVEVRLFSTVLRAIEAMDVLGDIATSLRPVGHFSVEKRSAYMRITGCAKPR